MESSSSTLHEERGASNWSLPKLPSSYFTSEIFLDHVRAVNDFVSYNNEIIATKKREACEEAIPPDESSTPSKQQNVEVHHQTPTSVTRPASLLEITCPPVAQITPEKEVASFQACRGWTGPPLFPQS